MDLTDTAALEKKGSTLEKVDRWLDHGLLAGILIFSLLLPFHLVIKKIVPDPLGTYWKEILLGLLVLAWAGRSAVARRPLLTSTPLDAAILVYLGLFVLRFLLDGAGTIPAWGFYMSVMYLPLFWIIPVVLKERPGWLHTFLSLLVFAGGLVALGGVLEFIFDVSLWPSQETVARQGFPDVFVYGTHLRRVYFVFDSPTTLANTLAILLPVALALVFITPERRMKWITGASAVVIAGCIVLTFSRGIWVASLLSLAAMGFWAVRFYRNELFPDVPLQKLSTVKPVYWALGGGGVLVAAVLVLFILAGKRTGAAYSGVVELAPEAFNMAPAVQYGPAFLEMEPLHGSLDLQEWTLLDPISNQPDTRKVLYKHPSGEMRTEVIYQLDVPPQGAVRFAIALAPEVWDPQKGDGVTFQIFAASSDIPEHGVFVFDRHINPKLNPNDRRWRNYIVDLSGWAGKTIHLSLITGCGSSGDCSFDWAGWGDMRLVTVESGFISQQQSRENPLVRHLGSIFDWQRDETNRDRLAAWSLGLSAWRESPLWGNGLGTTGAAALRTHPATAYVTESQVLKSLTELGLPGVLVLAFLWFAIGKTGLRAYQRAQSWEERLLLVGIFAGLLVVFIEGWVYQNLEVKQVNAGFWTLTGVLAFLSGSKNG